MKKSAYLGIFVLLAGAIFLAPRAMSGDPDPAKGMSPEDQAKMAECMMMAQPGDHHKHLEIFVGSWLTKTKVWMSGPGSDPLESSGTSKFKWVLDGRFVQEAHHGSMMGMPYEGIGMIGYDGFRNMYTTSWYSNMGTNVLASTGARNPETGVFTYYGQMDEPALNVVGRVVKYVCRFENSNKFVFSIIDLHAGDDYKVIEIAYERK